MRADAGAVRGVGVQICGEGAQTHRGGIDGDGTDAGGRGADGRGAHGGAGGGHSGFERVEGATVAEGARCGHALGAVQVLCNRLWHRIYLQHQDNWLFFTPNAEIPVGNPSAALIR